MLWLLLDGNRHALAVKLHHAVFPGIPHIIAENSCALFPGCHFPKHPGKALSVENIISQNQRHAVIPDKFRPDDKGVCQSSWLLLHCIGHPQPQLLPCSQKFLEYRKIPGCGYNQNILDTRQHQDR